jgi:3',5'-cyclic AMP phosphodiesterase CpdA
VIFSLAHFSDVHLGPLPKGALLHQPAMKKFIGALSWKLTRQRLHLPEIAAALRADISAAKPDHIAFTGDLLNISAHQEFERGVEWVRQLGSGDLVSYTPGNHDAYVPTLWPNGLGKFAAHMTNENPKDTSFPFIRLRRNVALIGVNGARPQSLFRAGGTVGTEQRLKLSANLKSLRERGFYRVVMIHHPPLPGLTHPRRALSDAADLQEILETEGAELVIHGHNHERSLNFLKSKFGTVPVIGVPSASMTTSAHHDVAAWNLYEIDRVKGNWQTRMTIRKWNSATKTMQPETSTTIEASQS